MQLKATARWFGRDNKLLQTAEYNLPVSPDLSFDEAIAVYERVARRMLIECETWEVERIRSDIKLGGRYDVVWTVRDEQSKEVEVS